MKQHVIVRSIIADLYLNAKRVFSPDLITVEIIYNKPLSNSIPPAVSIENPPEVRRRTCQKRKDNFTSSRGVIYRPKVANLWHACQKWQVCQISMIREKIESIKIVIKIQI